MSNKYRKPTIPTTSALDQSTERVVRPIKETLDLITGANPKLGEVAPLSTSAALADVVAKVNEIIYRLRASGDGT